MDACFRWSDEHLCVPVHRPSIYERLLTHVRDDLPHGDWRRFRSRTQHCDCQMCHAAWLDHEYDNRY